MVGEKRVTEFWQPPFKARIVTRLVALSLTFLLLTSCSVQNEVVTVEDREKILKQEIEEQGETGDRIGLLAITLLKELKFSEARALLDAQEGRFDDSPYIQSAEGLYYLASPESDLEKAKSYFKKGIELDPSMVLPKIGLAMGYWLEGKFDEEEKLVEEAYSLNSSSALTNFWRGNVYLRNGNREKAKAAYNAAISFDQNYENPYLALGDIYFDEKEFTNAEKHYEKYLQLNKVKFPDYGYNNLALIYLQKGELKKAKSMCDEGVAITEVKDRLSECLEKIEEHMIN